MRKFTTLLILLTLFLAGCTTASTPTEEMMQAPEASSTPTVEPPTSTPIPTTAPNTPTPTHIPNAIPTEEVGASLFQFYEGNPVFQQSNNPSWDNVYMDPGAMIYYNGMFHMFFNGINGFPASVGVGYATSSDGYHWTRQVSEPLLQGRQVVGTNLSGSNFFVTSVLVEGDGTWVLYFYTQKGNNFNGGSEIGRATAPTPTGPWTLNPDPVLSTGPKGSWDGVQVTAPDVHKTNDGYVMYYDAHGNETTSMIGMATSTDGIHWTKYNDPATTDTAFADSDPVLKVGASGWDSTRVIDPNVVQTPDGWVMIYLATTGAGKFAGTDFSFGAATSTDGIHWKKSTQNPILSNRDHKQWVSTYLATLLFIDNTYYLYFDLVSSKDNGTNVYLATYNGTLK